jgi:transposase
MTAEEEVILLRQENQALRERVHVQQETIEQQQHMIAGLQKQAAELVEHVQALQERVKKDSHNSHLPPSSDRFHRQPKSLRTKSGKKPGGQVDHPGSSLKLSPTPDTLIIHAVEQCQHCQADLRQVESLYVERRQVLDVPPKRVIVIEHQAHQKYCPRCHEISVAVFPEDVRAPVQYAAALGAVGVYLVQQQLLPYERACEVLEDLLGPAISVGTLAGLVERCAKQLEPVEQQIKAALSQVPVLHQDETGLYVAGQRQWMHVSSTESLTHYAVHPKRGKEALDAIGILADFAGVSVHDGWRSYWQLLCQHALCNVHHLRELIFLQEEQQQEWAGEMKELLLDIKAAVAQARSEGRTSLHPLEVADWKVRYRARLSQGYQANPPPDPPTEGGKKGRPKQSKARNLLDRLSQHQDAVLCFLEMFSVPFDNSLAERDIRMVKVQQKISGCFRSEAFAVDFCRIRGYLSTLRKQGVAVLTALEQALLGHPVSPAF